MIITAGKHGRLCLFCNKVKKIIKENEQKYYNEMDSLCASDPKKMWSKEAYSDALRRVLSSFYHLLTMFRISLQKGTRVL